MKDNPIYPIASELTLTGAFQIVYTVNRVRWFNAQNIHIVNTTATSKTLRLCLVPPGGTADQSNAWLWDFSIPGNDFLEFIEGQWIAPLWTVQASANAVSAINVFISGIEQPLFAP